MSWIKSDMKFNNHINIRVDVWLKRNFDIKSKFELSICEFNINEWQDKPIKIIYISNPNLFNKIVML